MGFKTIKGKKVHIKNSKKPKSGQTNDLSQFIAYDVKARRNVTVKKGIKIVTLKNGRKALRGISPDTGNIVNRIIKTR